MKTPYLIILLGLSLFCMYCNKPKPPQGALSPILIAHINTHAQNIRAEKGLKIGPNLLVSVITENDISFDSTFVYLHAIRSKEFYEDILEYLEPNLFELSDSLGVLVLSRKNPVFVPQKQQALPLSKYLCNDKDLPYSSISLYFPIKLSFIKDKLVKIDTVTYTSPLTILNFKTKEERYPMPVIRRYKYE